MRVAMIAPSHIPARRANTIQVMKMAQAIASLGHEVRLVSPVAGSSGADRSISWEELSRHYGLKTHFGVEWLPVFSFMRRYDFGYRSVTWARRWGAEIIYTRLPQTAAIASQVGIPTILEAHDIPHGTLGPVMFKAFLRGHGARRLVVITRSLKEDLVQRLGAPSDPQFAVIEPDGVDLSRYADLPEIDLARRTIQEKLNQNLEGARFVAGYTGHFYPGRGVELVLEIAQRLPEMLFLLVGGEPQDVLRLQEQIRLSGLMNVILSGFVPNADLPFYQAACDALLMPYQKQVAASSGGDIARYLSPMKLFEYMACGRAILSSDLPVLQEILKTDFALLLPSADVTRWVGALQELDSDPHMRSELGQRARAAAKRYTWEARAQRILEGLAG
jgi:glycosyltransferase involved in cell wall biosynthesis